MRLTRRAFGGLLAAVALCGPAVLRARGERRDLSRYGQYKRIRYEKERDLYEDMLAGFDEQLWAEPEELVSW